MISSEVQRTLVKSPPELWAELSDPAALARHLGELGEIRITRVEPEQLVEWEADNRTGTVQIKPSGWGTKVTLTVDTEVSEPSTREEPPAPDEDEPAALAEDYPTSFATTEPPAPAEAEPVSPVEEEPPAPEESVPSRLGAPLTAAAASSWRADTEPAWPEDQSPGWIGEDTEALPPEDEDGEKHGETHEWLAYEELEPRRGFLARLFGRWRRPQPAEAEPAEMPENQPPAGEGPPQGAGSPVEEALSSEINAHGDDESLSPDTGVATDPAAARATPEAPIEMTPAEAASADEHEPVQAPPAPLADAAVAEPLALSPGTGPAGQSGDIAGELKAAEETEDAEVTAVLTSVLDRLGAAHHRPFSRS